jgi:hypothetical protein
MKMCEINLQCEVTKIRVTWDGTISGDDNDCNNKKKKGIADFKRHREMKLDEILCDVKM